MSLNADEALRGVLPAPFTREQWRTLANASLAYVQALHDAAEFQRQTARFDRILGALTREDTPT